MPRIGCNTIRRKRSTTQCSHFSRGTESEQHHIVWPLSDEATHVVGGLNNVKLRNKTFRILLPVIYVIVTMLFIGGIIVTIAEGSNPFGFLYYAALYPGLYLLDVLPNWLLPLRTNGWLLISLTALANLGVYFVVGYLIDFTINRFRA